MNRLPPKCKCVFTHFSRRKQTKTQRFIPMWDIDRQNEQDKLMKIKIFTVNLNFKELETKRLTKWKCEYLQSLGGKTYVKKKKRKLRQKMEVINSIRYHQHVLAGVR